MRDEMRLEAQLFTDDARIEDKMIILIDDQPTQLSNVRWTLENKTEPAHYVLASYLFAPSEQMKQNMRLADADGHTGLPGQRAGDGNVRC